MRAKKVYENLNFERGKDPIKALNIGRKTQLTKELEEIADHLGGFHEDIPKVIDFLLSKDAQVKLLAFDSDDLADVYWTNDSGQRRRSRVGWPEYDETTVKVPKRKWYGKKYYTEELANRGPFISMVDWINWSEEHLSSDSPYYKGVLDREIVKENQDFERGLDPLKTMGLGLYGIIDKEAEGMGFTRKAKMSIVANPGGPKIGMTYQWHDKYGANSIEYFEEEGKEDKLISMNSEEGFFKVEGADEILNAIKSGKLRKFINLE